MSDGCPRLAWTHALGWPASRHHLVKRARPADPGTVGAEICGLPAQVMSSAALSQQTIVELAPFEPLSTASCIGAAV
jgi:hypothetical protein